MGNCQVTGSSEEGARLAISWEIVWVHLEEQTSVQTSERRGRHDATGWWCSPS
jgi:hypothetical protein